MIFFSKNPIKGYVLLIMVKYEQVWTYSLSPKKYQKKITLFPIVNLAVSHCFTKTRCAASNSRYIFFFWILVYMIAVHHCAKEQLAWLDVVQIRAPYCTVQSSEILFHAVPCHPPVYNPPRQDVGTECRTGSFGSNLMSKHAQVKYNTQYSRRYLEYFTGKRPICHLQVKADQQVTWGLAILSGLLCGW